MIIALVEAAVGKAYGPNAGLPEFVGKAITPKSGVPFTATGHLPLVASEHATLVAQYLFGPQLAVAPGAKGASGDQKLTHPTVES